MADGAHWRRAALRRTLLPLAVLAVGVALVVAFDGGPEYVGWAFVGAAAVIALSLAFLEVGYSEDRARARERPPRPPGRAGGRAGRRPR